MPRITGSSFFNGCYVYVDYTVGTQNPVDRTTTVHWTIGVHNGSADIRYDNAQATFTATGGVTGDATPGPVSTGWPTPAGQHQDQALESSSFQAIHNTSGGCTVSITGSVSSDFGTSSISTSFALAQIVPSAPGTPSCSDPGSTTATITWAAPSGVGSGGSGLTGRQIQVSTNSGFSNIVIDNTSTWGTSYNATGLSKNATYWVRVKAVNAAGSGTFSAIGSFTTDSTTPGTPNAPTFSGVGGTSLTVNWSAPSDTGGLSITSYRVQRATNSGFSTGLVETDLSTTSLNVTGLSPVTTYYFRVRATNSAGNSSYSSTASQATGITVPGAPATPSTGSLTSVSVSISWSAPSDTGGSSITGYDLQRATSADFSHATTSADVTSPRSITNLSPNTTYWVRVRAKNAAGAGAWSSGVSFTTLSGARIGNGSGWTDTLIWIGDGSTWVAHRPRPGFGSAWSN